MCKVGEKNKPKDTRKIYIFLHKIERYDCIMIEIGIWHVLFRNAYIHFIWNTNILTPPARNSFFSCWDPELERERERERERKSF